MDIFFGSKRKKKAPSSAKSMARKTVNLTAGIVGLRVAGATAAGVPGRAGMIAGRAVDLSSVGLLKEAAEGF